MSKKKSFVVDIKPEILRWAFNNSGWTREEIANKLQVNIESLNAWLGGTEKPTIKDVENLAQILKRPLAAFFLAEPPKDMPLPKDYRMIPDKIGKFDNKTLLAIRKARRLQRISKELSENLKEEIKSKVTTAVLSDNPKEVAKKYIEFFKINDDLRNTWKSPYDTFNYFRDLIEDMGVLVFKMSMPVQDARGFALVDEEPDIMVVNSKDLPEAQVFTLLHEFGHVILNKTGISMPDNALFKEDAGIVGVEKWCNEFSSAIILPKRIAKVAFDRNKNRLIETQTLRSLSKKLKISKAMLLYNMRSLNYITTQQYRLVLNRYDPTRTPTKAPPKKGKKEGGGVSVDKKCMSGRGQTFVSLVAKNVAKGHITRNDALDFLSVKSKHLDKIMGKAKK